jgi:small subunit ribosomal protein S6
LKAYRGLFVFSGALDDDALEKAVGRVKDEIVRLDGEVTETEMLGKRAFARPMNQGNSGSYVVVHFRMEPAQVVALPARLKLNEDVFRSQILQVEEGRSRAEGETKEAKSDGQS